MENRIFRTIGMAILGTLLLLFVLPALLRLLIVAAVATTVYRFMRRRYLRKQANYYGYAYPQDHIRRVFAVPQTNTLNWSYAEETETQTENPIIIKIG